MFVTNQLLLFMAFVCLVGATLITMLLVRTVDDAIKHGPWMYKFKVDVPDECDPTFEAVETETPPDADVELPPFLKSSTKSGYSGPVTSESIRISYNPDNNIALAPFATPIPIDSPDDIAFAPPTMSSTFDIEIDRLRNEVDAVGMQLSALRIEFDTMRGMYWRSVNYSAGDLSPSIMEMIKGLEKNVRELRSAVRAVKPIIVREKDVLEKKGKKKK